MKGTEHLSFYNNGCVEMYEHDDKSNKLPDFYSRAQIIFMTFYPYLEWN